LPIGYRIDVIAALKAAGYSTYRIRKDKLLSESTLQLIREGKLVSWENIATICGLLQCQPGDILENQFQEAPRGKGGKA
jgi:Predicted transcriptional regulator